MSNSTTFPEFKVTAAYATVVLSEVYPSFALFLTYGKCDPWVNPYFPEDPNVSDLTPLTPDNSVQTVLDAWDNMIGAKRLLGSDFHFVTKRYNWTYGTVYDEYDNLNSDLSTYQFYVVNSDFCVYKCLSNGGFRESYIEPTTISPSRPQATPDGYIWKFMYKISDSEQLNFTTDNYIPVKTLAEDDGSLQWQVQLNAQLKPSGIDVIKIENGYGGSGYSVENEANLVVTIVGDGINCTARAVVNPDTSSIDRIIVTEPGLGYTYAYAYITDTTPPDPENPVEQYPPQLRPIISPPGGGHGANPLFELFGSNIMINATLKYDEEGYFPTTNDFRQVGILVNPILNRQNSRAKDYLANNPIAAADPAPFVFFPAALQATTLICSGFGDFLQDEMVYQGPSQDQANFLGIVLSWDAATGRLLLINTKGLPFIPQSIIGTKSLTTRTVTSYDPGTMQKGTGSFIYLDNITPVSRSSDQIENFKILIKF